LDEGNEERDVPSLVSIGTRNAVSARSYREGLVGIIKSWVTF